MMARGCLHTVSTHADMGAVRTVPLAHAWPLPQSDTPGDAPPNALLSGAYQFWHNPVHPFFAEMPDWLVLRAQDGPYPRAMANSMELLQQELARHELGSETLVYGLLDVIYVLLMREMLQRQGARTACWSHGIQDPQVMKAVQAMHDDCARAWTLDKLAQHAGLSRTSLAERFRESMGNTPLNYLRTVRMQKAMAALSESERSLEQIAREVGYTDASAFPRCSSARRAWPRATSAARTHRTKRWRGASASTPPLPLWQALHAWWERLAQAVASGELRLCRLLWLPGGFLLVELLGRQKQFLLAFVVEPLQFGVGAFSLVGSLPKMLAMAVIPCR